MDSLLDRIYRIRLPYLATFRRHRWSNLLNSVSPSAIRSRFFLFLLGYFLSSFLSPPFFLGGREEKHASSKRAYGFCYNSALHHMWDFLRRLVSICHFCLLGLGWIWRVWALIRLSSPCSIYPNVGLERKTGTQYRLWSLTLWPIIYSLPLTGISQSKNQLCTPACW